MFIFTGIRTQAEPAADPGGGDGKKSTVRHDKETPEAEIKKGTIKNDDERPVYGLVINGGDIATDSALHAVYKRFLADNQLMPDGIIRVIPVCTVDFAGVMLNLVEDEAYDFKSSVLARVFDTLIDKLRQQNLPDKENWMETVFLNTIDADRFPELDLKEQEQSDKQDESVEDEPAESDEDKPDDDSKPK